MLIHHFGSSIFALFTKSHGVLVSMQIQMGCVRWLPLWCEGFQKDMSGFFVG
jgi:hypothetical protein